MLGHLVFLWLGLVIQQVKKNNNNTHSYAFLNLSHYYDWGCHI